CRTAEHHCGTAGDRWEDALRGAADHAADVPLADGLLERLFAFHRPAAKGSRGLADGLREGPRRRGRRGRGRRSGSQVLLERGELLLHDAGVRAFGIVQPVLLTRRGLDFEARHYCTGVAVNPSPRSIMPDAGGAAAFGAPPGSGGPPGFLMSRTSPA